MRKTSKPKAEAVVTPMSPEEFREQCAAIGLVSWEQKAALFEVKTRTVRYWEEGKSRIPGTVKLVLKLLREHPRLRRNLGGFRPSNP